MLKITPHSINITEFLSIKERTIREEIDFQEIYFSNPAIFRTKRLLENPNRRIFPEVAGIDPFRSPGGGFGLLVGEKNSIPKRWLRDVFPRFLVLFSDLDLSRDGSGFKSHCGQEPRVANFPPEL